MDNEVEMIDLSQDSDKPIFCQSTVLSTNKNSILKTSKIFVRPHLTKSVKNQNNKNSLKAENNGEEIIDLTLDSESQEITPKIDVVIDSEGKEKLQCSLCTVCLLYLQNPKKSYQHLTS